MKKYILISLSLIIALILASIYPIVMHVQSVNNELTLSLYSSNTIVSSMSDGYFIGIIVLYSIVFMILIALIIAIIIFVRIRKNIKSYKLTNQIIKSSNWN